MGLLFGPRAALGQYDDDEIPPDEDEELAADDEIPPDEDEELAVDEDEETDELEMEWGIRLQSDLRFRVEEKSVGAYYDRRTLPVGIDRNENLIGLRLNAQYGDVSAVAELDFVLYGYAQDVETLADLSRREKLDPFRFEAHKLYVEVADLGFDGLDLAVGQQIIAWGVGDQFNPTNNLNSDDMEDVLLFGEQQGNFMVKADYWIDESWSMSGVLVPIFRPALLPRSGELQIARVDRLPFVDEELRHRVHAEQAAAQALAQHPTIVTSVTPVLPDKTIANMQVGYRIGGTIGGQDVSASYYNGRTDFPVPFRNRTVQNSEPQCNPNDASDCINGLLETTTFLHYPRMHVYGFNWAGEVGWLEAISDVFNSVGYRFEVGFVVPERATIELTNGDLDLGLAVIPGGEYDYDADGAPGGPQAVVVEDTPFAKWTVGLDYTFNKYLYTNVQWVHGLPDEYGAGDFISDGAAVRSGGVDSDDAGTVACALGRDGTACATETLRPRIADYLVTGIDLRLLDQQLLLRLFTIFDLSGVDMTKFDAEAGERVSEHHNMFSEQGFGAVIYPEVGYNFGNGLELQAGTLLQLGKAHGKFGDPAAGGSIVWTRGRFSF